MGTTLPAMTMRRMLAMTGGALVPLAVLSLLVGNQWVTDAIAESGFEFGDGIGPLVSWLFALAWRFTPRTGADWRSVVSDDFSLLVLFAVLAVLVAGGIRLTDPERGPFGAVIIGWWAAVVAAGASGLVSGPLSYWALDFPDDSLSMVIFSSIGQGAAFGLAFGWLSGLGALGGLFLGRPREAGPRPPGAQQPYGPPQPYAAQPGMPMQQPYPQQAPPQQMPQQMPHQPHQPHPSAVPYVPPQGQPPQAGWGAGPVPQQPGQPGQPGGQFGAPPVPQQPSAPPQEQAPPPASPAEPEEAPRDAPGEAPKGPGEDAPEDAGDDTPKDDPKDEPADDGKDDGKEDGDDDLDLADRTVIDRRRDDDT
ncbi:Uncharacterised protein [Actinomadura madurae]|nr:Uncharacterised protein [Actinomadura madurae]